MTSIHGTKPLYVDTHRSASVLVAEFRNQAALLALPEARQFQFLHASVYVALDEVADRHKVYKVHGGPLGFMLCTNVAETDAQHAATLLRCGQELVHVVGQVLLPCGQPLGVTMALGTGAITSGLLGAVSLTYQLVGRCVAVAHQLCRVQPAAPLMATRSFCDALPPAMAAQLLPLGRVVLPCCPGEPVEVSTLAAFRGLPAFQNLAQPAALAAKAPSAVGARAAAAAANAPLQHFSGTRRDVASELGCSSSGASAPAAGSGSQLDATAPGSNADEPPMLL